MVLRIHQREDAAAAREALLVARVRGDVPVPAVLHHEPEGPGGKAFTVMEFVPGVLLARVLEEGPDPRRTRAGDAVGRVLASLQRHRFPAAGFLGPGLAVDAFPEGEPLGHGLLLGVIEEPPFREALGPTRRDSLRHFLEANRAAYPVPDGTLCHADFKGANLLLTPDGSEVVALLDWEFAFAGHPLFDLAALLRWDHVLAPAYVRAVVAGYRESGGVLPPGWFARVKALDLLNLVTMLDRAPPTTRRRRDLLALIDRTLEAWPPPDPDANPLLV